jgi:hypothetical protein
MQQKLVQKSQREREKKKVCSSQLFHNAANQNVEKVRIKMSKKFESKCRKSSNQNVEKFEQSSYTDGTWTS